jgi:hypothetical protein
MDTIIRLELEQETNNLYLEQRSGVCLEKTLCEN